MVMVVIVGMVVAPSVMITTTMVGSGHGSALR
jgi:hypothetical protein